MLYYISLRGGRGGRGGREGEIVALLAHGLIWEHDPSSNIQSTRISGSVVTQCIYAVLHIPEGRERREGGGDCCLTGTWFDMGT